MGGGIPYLNFHHYLLRCVSGDDQLHGQSAVVDRLVDRIGRNVKEIAGPDGQSFFQILADQEPALATDYVNSRFAVDMVVGTGRATCRYGCDGQMDPSGPYQALGDPG